MAKKTKSTTADILQFSSDATKDYIFLLQEELQAKLNTGLTLDDILDEEDPFEELEPLLPQEVYPVFVLAMINNIRSDTVMDAILEGLEKGISQYRNRNREDS